MYNRKRVENNGFQGSGWSCFKDRQLLFVIYAAAKISCICILISKNHNNAFRACFSSPTRSEGIDREGKDWGKKKINKVEGYMWPIKS